MIFTENVLQIHRLYTEKFWTDYGQTRKAVKYKSYSRKSKTETIEALKLLGEVKLVYKNGTKPEKMRKLWDKRKITRKKFTGFTYCFACRDTAQCRHHIIWIKNGGRNIRKNIVALCNDCHAEIHTWLKAH